MKNIQKYEALSQIEKIKKTIFEKESVYNSKIEKLQKEIKALEEEKIRTTSGFYKELKDLEEDKKNNLFKDKFVGICNELRIKNKVDFMNLLTDAYNRSNPKILYYNPANPKHSKYGNQMTNAEWKSKSEAYIKINLDKLEIEKDRKGKIKELIFKL